jgi:hypothetical protein
MLAENADLPLLAHDDPAFAGPRFHEVLDDLVSRSWLVRSDLGYLVLGREPGMALLKDRRLSFPAVELLELQRLTDGIIYDDTTKGLMAQSGQPHARLRRLVSAAFTPRQVERLRPRLRAYLAGLWQDIAQKGRCDVVTALARPLPSMAIAELLGVPGDAALLARWSAGLQAVFDMDMTANRAEIEAACEDVRDYVLDLVPRRRQRPGEELVSVLVQHEQDGDRLSDDEIVTLASSVIAGGTDSTESQLAHGLRLFADHPDQWDRLGDNPALAEHGARKCCVSSRLCRSRPGWSAKSGHDGVDPDAQPGPQSDQRHPVAQQRPQLPHLRHGDPRLRQLLIASVVVPCGRRQAPGCCTLMPLGSGASYKMASRDLDTIGIHYAPLARLASFAFSPRDLIGARHQRRHVAETIRVIARDPDWAARSVRFVLLAAGITDFTDVLHLKPGAKPVLLLRVQRKSKTPSPRGKGSDTRVSFPEAVPAAEATDKVGRVSPCHQYRVGGDCPEGGQSSSRHDCYDDCDRINL